MRTSRSRNVYTGGGGVLCKVNGIVCIEPFKKGSEEVRTMEPKQEYIVDK